MALIVESALVPAWIAALVARLAGSSTVELDVYASGHERPRDRRPVLLALYESIDARVFRGRPDALEPVAIDVSSPAPESFEAFDVVLDLTSSTPPVPAAGVTYGVWVLAHGPTDANLYEIRIDARFEDGTRANVHASCGMIDPASPHRTWSQALWKAKGAFASRLETIRRLGHGYLQSRTRTEHGDGTAPKPASNLAVVDAAGRAASGVVVRRVRSLRTRRTWFIAVRPRRGAPLTGRDSDSTEGFVPLRAASTASHADPFLFEHEGETYLFFEDEDERTGRAHISYVTLDVQGKPSAAKTALERPYHLSYPFVFRHGEDVFLIPDSSANRTVELYRASPFPTNWTLDSVLLRGMHAVDATLLVEDGRLWMFVGVAEVGASSSDELHLYSSQSLRGPWSPHPANPVVSDVRSARPAGRIFRHDGELIRPAQDGSRGYGYAIVFNRIDVLDDREYRETPIGRIEPTWHPGLIGTHTYDFGERFEALDGRRLVTVSPFARIRR